MHRDGNGLRPPLLGEDPRLTRAAVGAAVLLFLVATILDYVTTWSLMVGKEYAIVDAVWNTFYLDDVWRDGWARVGASWTWVYGYLLVVGLAGTHAYFNRGYLTSLLLAVSPTVGAVLWTIRWPDLAQQYLALTPVRALGRAFPEGPIVATVGFFLGLGLRHATQSDPTHHGSEPPAAEK